MRKRFFLILFVMFLGIFVVACSSKEGNEVYSDFKRDYVKIYSDSFTEKEVDSYEVKIYKKYSDEGYPIIVYNKRYGGYENYLYRKTKNSLKMEIADWKKDKVIEKNKVIYSQNLKK